MERTPEQWEAHVKEELANSDEMQLLDLAQDCAIKLADTLSDAKGVLRSGARSARLLNDALAKRVGRLAVMLDVLQLRYKDAADEELSFLKDIEDCLE